MTDKPESLLARFGGKPPTPSRWFAEAMANEPDRRFFDCDGAQIEMLVWGEEGKPGLLFLHGSGAQADWWTPLVPFLANHYRCAAISWSGMGRSGWRDVYSIDQWTREALGAIEAAGLDAAGAPVVIGHSLGGSPLVQLGADYPNRIRAGILVDSFVMMAKRKRPSSPSPKLPRYASVEEALARYRLRPEQPTDWPEIVDHIARHSIRPIEADADGPAGWTWRFDPLHMGSLDLSVLEDMPARVAVPMALIIGEQSALINEGQFDEIRKAMPAWRTGFSIPDGRHHLMIDQPLALVTAIRSILAMFDAEQGAEPTPRT